MMCVLFLVGCGLFYNGNYDDIHSGTEGLTYTVLDGFVRNVLEEELFEIPLMFHNQGVTDLTGNIYGLFSYTYDTYYLDIDASYTGDFIDNDPYDMNLFEENGGYPIYMPGGIPFGSFSQLAIDLQRIFGTQQTGKKTGTVALAVLGRGKSLEFPTGAKIPGRLPFVARKLNEGQQMQRTRILTQLCYPYVSMFETDICIDQDKYGLDVRDKVCVDEDVVVSSSQGSPIAVQDIDVTFVNIANSVAPRFMITFRNLGNGVPFIYMPEQDLFDLDSSYAYDIYDACAVKSQNKNNWNKAIVIPVFLDTALSCTNNNILVFDEYGEARTYCSFPGVIADVYNRPEYGSYADMWSLFEGVNANDLIGRIARDWGQVSFGNDIASLLSGAFPSGTSAALDMMQPNFRSYFLIKTSYFYVEHDSIDVTIERCLYC